MYAIYYTKDDHGYWFKFSNVSLPGFIKLKEVGTEFNPETEETGILAARELLGPVPVNFLPMH